MDAKVIEDPSLRDRSFVFRDRLHAAELLSKALLDLRGKDALVIAIPLGGIPVACRLAEGLQLQVRVAFVTKVQFTHQPEAGFGAVSDDGEVLLDEELMRTFRVDDRDESIGRARTRLLGRMSLLGQWKLPASLDEKIAILVDDGLATGYTMGVATKSVRKREPQQVVVAVPTASRSAIERISSQVDTICCLNIRKGPFFAVADAYSNWYDVSEEEALASMRRVSTQG